MRPQKSAVTTPTSEMIQHVPSDVVVGTPFSDGLGVLELPNPCSQPKKNHIFLLAQILGTIFSGYIF